MTQVINKKLMKCCVCCKSHFDKPCAWLSLGNEYCTEIIETQKVIDQLTNNWNELEEWLEKQRIRNSEWEKFVQKDTRLGIPIGYLLDKMKEIKEGKK